MANSMQQYNPQYAGTTQKQELNGKTYAHTYGQNGEYLGSKMVPNTDYDLAAGRNTGSVYDRFFMTNSELNKIDSARQAAQNGTGTWEDANKLAESIRGAYGYSGGSDGSGYKVTGTNVYGGVRDPKTLLKTDSEQQLANQLAGNYGNKYMDWQDGLPAMKQGTAQGTDDYSNFMKSAASSGLLGQFSENDLKLAQENPNYGNALLQSKINYNNATTPEQRALAAAEGESLRNTMQSGGLAGTAAAGSGAGTSGYGTGASGYGTGSGTSGYGTSGASSGTLGDIQGFNYSQYKQTPDYSALMESQANNGRLAMEDTLGQVSARTGGLASSYAQSAAQQAYQQYMTEAEQEAYDRYRDALNDLYNLYSLQTEQEETMYQREMDALDREAEADDDAITMAKLKAQYGDYSGLQELGIDLSALLGTEEETSGGSSGGTYRKSNNSDDGDDGDDGTPIAEDTAGYNTNRFDAAMSSMNTALRQGRVEGAVQGLESIWNQLNNAQKTTAQALLAKYGLGYEE